MKFKDLKVGDTFQYRVSFYMVCEGRYIVCLEAAGDEVPGRIYDGRDKGESDVVKIAFTGVHAYE